MSQFNDNFQKLYDLVKSSNPIIIQRHINPDGDALGSQWGLKVLISENFPNKTILIPGDMNNHMSKFFSEPDKVSEEDYKDALVIICDTANKERISGEFWTKGKSVIKIDHHPEVDPYGSINLVDEKSSAACQVIAKWAYNMKLKISKEAARHLFLGLVTDSGRFLYRSVSQETFELASFLMSSGLNLLDLYESLYSQNIKMARIRGHILSNFEVSASGVASIIFDKDRLSKLVKIINKNEDKVGSASIDLIREDITSQVNLMANLSGVKIWMIACQDENQKEFKVSVRSNRWVINEVVAKFGGGGHKYAAGARISNLATVKKLLKALDEKAKSVSELTNN